MGNALAARVANKNIELLKRGNWQKQIALIEARFKTILEPCRELANVRDVRVLGGIGVVEVDRQVDLDKVRPILLEQGVWLRPFRNLIYSMPPYVISETELEKICKAICRIVETKSYY